MQGEKNSFFPLGWCLCYDGMRINSHNIGLTSHLRRHYTSVLALGIGLWWWLEQTLEQINIWSKYLGKMLGKFSGKWCASPQEEDERSVRQHLEFDRAGQAMRGVRVLHIDSSWPWTQQVGHRTRGIGMGAWTARRWIVVEATKYEV